MTSNERWEYLNGLDEELLQGGVILPEWTTLLVRDADTAFCEGAPLAAILAAQAGIECQLRAENAPDTKRRWNFHDLIEQSGLPDEMKQAMHELRRYRNRWVHVNEPWDDAVLLGEPEYHEEEVQRMALSAVTLLHRIAYWDQGI